MIISKKNLNSKNKTKLEDEIKKGVLNELKNLSQNEGENIIRRYLKTKLSVY